MVTDGIISIYPFKCPSRDSDQPVGQNYCDVNGEGVTD